MLGILIGSEKPGIPRPQSNATGGVTGKLAAAASACWLGTSGASGGGGVPIAIYDMSEGTTSTMM